MGSIIAIIPIISQGRPQRPPDRRKRPKSRKLSHLERSPHAVVAHHDSLDAVTDLNSSPRGVRLGQSSGKGIRVSRGGEAQATAKGNTTGESICGYSSSSSSSSSSSNNNNSNSNNNSSNSSNNAESNIGAAQYLDLHAGPGPAVVPEQDADHRDLVPGPGAPRRRRRRSPRVRATELAPLHLEDLGAPEPAEAEVPDREVAGGSEAHGRQEREGRGSDCDGRGLREGQGEEGHDGADANGLHEVLALVVGVLVRHGRHGDQPPDLLRRQPLNLMAAAAVVNIIILILITIITSTTVIITFIIIITIIIIIVVDALLLIIIIIFAIINIIINTTTNTIIWAAGSIQ